MQNVGEEEKTWFQEALEKIENGEKWNEEKEDNEESEKNHLN